MPTAITTKRQPAPAPVEVEPVSFRFNKSEASFTQTNKANKLTYFRARRGVLTLDPAKTYEGKLIDYLRSSRRNGLDWREVKEDDQDEVVQRNASALDQLMAMDRSAVWSQFTLPELNQCHLNEKSSKSELIAGFLELNKKVKI